MTFTPFRPAAVLLLASLSLAASSPSHSKTAPYGNLTVYAAGDIAECKNKPASASAAAKAAALISADSQDNPHFRVITLGDNTYPVGVSKEFVQCYEPTWGKFKTQTLPSPGNHEYYTPSGIGYFGYFEELAGPDRRGYYDVNIGNWHLISINSNVRDAEMQAQLTWLQLVLAHSKAKCTLAFWHHPAYSSGGHGNNAAMLPLWKLLTAAKADIVLNGHDHDYERFAPLNADGERDEQNGIREFVVGTGGAKLTPMFFRKSNSEVRQNDHFGILKLTLKDHSYGWEFLPVDGGEFSDKGSGQCHSLPGTLP